MPHLVVLEPSGDEKTLELEGDQFVIGRESGADIALEDKQVSRAHARIYRQGLEYWIQDLKSSNGVLIDGKKISRPHPLDPGVEIRIGPFVLTFYPQEPNEEGFTLVGVSEICAGQSFHLAHGEHTIGRDENNQIVIVDNSVSRKHAAVVVTPAGATLHDLNSRNGVSVNGQRVGQQLLMPGDNVRIGNVELSFQGPGGTTGSSPMLFSGGMGVQIVTGLGVVAMGLLIAAGVVTARRLVGPETYTNALARAYEQQIVARLSAANALAHEKTWDRAVTAYQAVLDQDPINRDARKGLQRAEAALKHQQTLVLAQRALTAKNPEQVLDYTRTIPSDSHYGPAASKLAEQAQNTLAKRAVDAAAIACRRAQWTVCHQKAREAATYDKGATSSVALIREAEGAMRAQGLTFTPWVNPTKSGAGSKP